MRAAILAGMVAAFPLGAAGQALTELMTADDAAGWEAVGRLDIDGKGFCTATLIAPDLVLTAAHCLYEREVSPPAAIPAERLEFLAGLRNGRAAAYRDVRRAVIHPDYRHDGTARAETSRWDVALLELAQPIRLVGLDPIPLGGTVAQGAEVGVVSYAHDRAEAPSIQELCGVIGVQAGVIVFSCDVDFGSSGAPVFRMEGGVPRLVSVVSAKAELDGARVAVGMDLVQPVAALMAMLDDHSFAAAPPGGVRVIRPGERVDTGARFVSVGD